LTRRPFSIIKQLRRAWAQHVLYRSRIPYTLWHDCLLSSPILMNLDRKSRHRLRKLTGLFLHEKAINGAQGLIADPGMSVYIAAQACLLILNLDIDYYRGWSEVIVYPELFTVSRDEHDSSGVVHQTRRVLAGESWRRGPVILAWADAKPGAAGHRPDSNVILHEFAHKLDMLDGSANGAPPLHHGMVRQAWVDAFLPAYESLQEQVKRDRHSGINPYAAENPAEFFAVVTEIFFQKPGQLSQLYPDVYRQLQLYYRQDPLHRNS